MKRSARRASQILGVVAVCGLSALPLTAQAAPGPDSTTSAAAPDTGSLETVVVTMRDQPDVSAVRGAARPARLRAVVSGLRDFADRDQDALTRTLGRWRAVGSVASYRPLWVVNAVSVTATPQVVAA